MSYTSCRRTRRSLHSEQTRLWILKIRYCSVALPPLWIQITTWCQEWDYTVSAFAKANSETRSVSCPRSTRWNTTFFLHHNTDNMAELAGLPTPRMDWSSSDAPQALKKFKNLCELYFSGPLKDKSEEEQVSYLLIWSGEEGIELVSTWSLTADERKKLSTYWEKFEEYVAPRSNFRLARYKLRTLKQEPGESVDSFLKKVRILVAECKFTNPDKHIIDALIFGSNNPRVQSKLLE